MDLVRPDLRIEDLLRRGVVSPAIRPDPAVRPLPGHPAPLLVRDDQFDAVLIDRLEVVLGRRIPELVRREFGLWIADLDRSGKLRAHAPLRAIGMVPAPV